VAAQEEGLESFSLISTHYSAWEIGMLPNTEHLKSQSLLSKLKVNIEWVIPEVITTRKTVNYFHICY